MSDVANLPDTPEQWIAYVSQAFAEACEREDWANMRFDADPYTGFSTNTTNLRVEVNALFHVRNSQGAYRIAAT